MTAPKTEMTWKICASLVFTFLFLAASVVLVDVLYFNPHDQKLSPYEYDEVMGWLPKRDFSRHIPQKDLAGHKYDAFLRMNHDRFRAYGDPNSKNTKILVLGDSYTGDPFTGNDEMYFNVLKSVLKQKYGKDVEIFAIGGGGYGTLQEYLLVKDYIKKIKPDLFILQFSDNDFNNNLYEWEKLGIVKNQSCFRPYYSVATGKIFHEQSAFARWYRFSFNHSYFFRRLAIIFQRLQYKYYNGYSRPLTKEETQKFHVGSYQVTKKLLELLRNEFSPETKLFIMLDPTDDKDLNDLQVKLAKETGYVGLAAPVADLNQYEVKHKDAVLRHADGGHLDILGNRILGEDLAAALAGEMKWQK